MSERRRVRRREKDVSSSSCSFFLHSCPFLHRNANDTEKRYHLRYFKTGICTHETDGKGHCLKNGLHCSYAHGANDLRQPALDSRELQNSDLALERLARLCLSLESERALNDDPKWSGENRPIESARERRRIGLSRPFRLALRSRPLQNRTVQTTASTLPTGLRLSTVSQSA